MESKTLRAIIFDLDGVLTATIEYHYASWSKALAPYNIPFTRQDNEKIRSLTRKQSLATILGGREVAGHIQEQILKRKQEHYLAYIANTSRSDVLPGVRELLEEIHTSGLVCSVASASGNARAVLERLELREFFHAIVDANDVARSKPAPDVYLRAALDLAVAPDQCLAIDDSAAGIYSASRAGMCPIAIGSAACIPAALICLPDLVDIHLATLQQAYSAWAGRTHPSAAIPNFKE